MSDNFNRTAYALQPVSLDEDPFDWDWAALQKEVDEPIGICSPGGWFGDITLASLEEEPPICDWWGVDDMFADHGSQSVLAHDQKPEVEAERQPDRYYPCVQRPMANEDFTTHLQQIDCMPDLGAEQVERLDKLPTHIKPTFACAFLGCKKRFASKGNLVRHQKSHGTHRDFPCLAPGCGYSFTRKDKLIDHIRAGHEEETLFTCPNSLCKALLTKDILPLHATQFASMNQYRHCPMPKCGFRVPTWDLDRIEEHLLGAHDSKGWTRFASLLASRGYHHVSAKVVCPICPDAGDFGQHHDFENHFMVTHMKLPQHKLVASGRGYWTVEYLHIAASFLMKCANIVELF